ncbi:hypothetical protein FRC08_004361 [Ceratobasidium sp. 394]|nr:hypothetical protein FRC08_004361 [Ceratobasidium sp. 394]
MPCTFSCNQCPQQFETKQELKLHKKQHGALICGPSSPPPNPLQSSSTDFPCPHCHEPFKRHLALVKHLQTEPSCPEQRRKRVSGPRITPLNQITNPDAVCPYCKHEFKKSGSLSKHLQTHAVCSKSHDACSNVPRARSSSPAASPTAASPAATSPAAVSPTAVSPAAASPATASPTATSPTTTLPGLPPRISLRSSHSVDDLSMARMSLDDDMRGQGVDIPNPVVNDLVEELQGEPDAEYWVYVENYPVRTVGEPTRQATKEEMGPRAYPDVGALADPDCFEVRHILLTLNMSGADREWFLSLKKFRKNAPWKCNRTLMRDVDKLPHGPGWSVEMKELTGDNGTTKLVEFWRRDSLEWVKKMVHNKQLGPYLQLKPQRHYTNSRRTKRH